MMSLPLDVQGLGQAQTCSFQNFFEVNKYCEKQLESHMFHFQSKSNLETNTWMIASLDYYYQEQFGERDC